MTERVDNEALLAARPMQAPRTPASAKLRLISAAVLAPLGLLVVWQGGWLFAACVGAVGVLMAFEWTRLVHGTGLRPIFYLHAAIVLFAVVAAVTGRPELGLLIAVVGVAPTAAVARRTGSEPMWSVIGVLYTTLPLISLVWIRSHGDLGLKVLVSLLFVIWATDTGAYLAGMTIGGPKLAPKVSPSKTWAGFAGGIFWGAVLSAIAALWADFRPIDLFVALGVALAILAQAGDIAESAVKRHFRAKDTSGFIPGHGGVLDRFDGLMFAAVAVALILLAQQNMA